MEIEEVALGDLTTYPGNPRKGNIEAIADSLTRYGQYKPLTVNRRGNTILAGNHTFMAAQALRWPHISVVFVDVDDDTAAKIVAFDNRIADLGSYDDTALADLLAGLADLDGTGYSDDDIDDLIAGIQEATVPQINIDTVINTQAETVPNENNVERRPSLAEYTERYNDKATRMVILDYPNDTYVWVIDKLAEHRKTANLETNADAIVNLMEIFFKESAPHA
jgi:hypothetical protein